MLKPAICYKEKLEKALAEYFYTDDMLYYIGEKESYLQEIADSGEGGLFQYAVVDESKEEIVGFIRYKVDYYAHSVFNFGIFSFDRGNLQMGLALKELLERFTEMHIHRLEFVCVSGNPAKEHYDKFAKHAEARGYIVYTHTCHDVIRDHIGNYHNTIIYEFLK